MLIRLKADEIISCTLYAFNPLDDRGHKAKNVPMAHVIAVDGFLQWYDNGGLFRLC